MAEKKKKSAQGNNKSSDMVNYFSGVGTPHPISEGMQTMRQILLESGFDEIHTSFFVESGQVRKLMGALYPVFRDSIYHLSWVRPEPVAPSYDVDRKIGERFPDLDRAELWNIVDSMDEDTSGEELLFTLKDELDLEIVDVIELMNMIPELREGEPRNENNTLRSFMPTSWLSTLEATYNPGELPLRLFTVATAFRREPQPDSSHIETYNILSVAVADKNMDMEKGRSVIGKIFDGMEVEDVTFKEKKYPFPFFEDGSELEIFGGDLEIGTCGIMSSEILKKQGVDTKVFLADIGVERLLMYKEGYPDIRELLYPQFFAAWNMTDEEIGSSIKYIRKPQTDYGKEIARAIYSKYKEVNGKEKTSGEVAWKGILVTSDYGKFLVEMDRAKDLKLEGNKAEIVLAEAGKGMGLCGPGAFNEIWIEDGNVMGVPPSMVKDMEKRGACKTNKNFVKAFSRFAAWKIERALKRGSAVKKVEKIKDLEGINLKMTSKALYYMLSHTKKVNVQGPVYLKFLFKVMDDR